MEVMSLLYNAALHAHASQPRPTTDRLNPTHGVLNNRPDLAESISFKVDASKPGGGVFLANDVVKRELDRGGVPQGTIEPVEPPPLPPPPPSYIERKMSVNLNPVIGIAPTMPVMPPLGQTDDRDGFAHGTPGSNLSDEFLVSGVPNQMFDWHSWDSVSSSFGLFLCFL